MVDLGRIELSAALLLSEDGENVEYDRAIAELMCEIYRIPQEHKRGVLLGLRNIRKEVLKGRGNSGNPYIENAVR